MARHSKQCHAMCTATAAALLAFDFTPKNPRQPAKPACFAPSGSRIFIRTACRFGFAVKNGFSQVREGNHAPPETTRKLT
jgi:hypothetical protein